MIPSTFVSEVERIVGEAFVIRDPNVLQAYGVDALNQGYPPDLAVRPGSTREVAAVAALCHHTRVPLVARGAGTGYSGGAVPVHGGVVLSLDRFNRILEIDEENLLAVVEPHVVVGDLHEAVERVGLFYPPDPASLRESVIGGNVAECAGGPRAFKYGTTRQYVLGLEAVLPTGHIVRTGSKTVKNVVGYDLTQLLVGSEGTLAIFTQIILRLLPRPPAHATVRATFATVVDAVQAVGAVIRARVVPAVIELIDGDCLEAVSVHTGAPLAPPGTAALLLIEVDGAPPTVADEMARVEAACLAAGATELIRAKTESERQDVWRVRRELSPALKLISPIKRNHDVVVPRGRVPALFDLVARIRAESGLRVPCFGHAGDGNIHVNIMVDPDDPDEQARARRAERALLEGVVALEGSISGEHGIGFAKAPYLSIALSAEELALMKRVKDAFDPHNVLNPGKIFPNARVVAVIGASADRRKFGNKAVRAFQRQGYTVIPIHPRAREVEGLLAYASVLDVPGPIDLATLYVPPEVGEELLEEVAAKHIREIWVNPGAESAALVTRARGLSLQPILGCSMVAIGEDPAAF